MLDENIEIEKIKVTELKPDKTYVFLVDFADNLGKDKMKHTCSQLKNILSSIGINNIAIIAQIKDVTSISIVEAEKE